MPYRIHARRAPQIFYRLAVLDAEMGAEQAQAEAFGIDPELVARDQRHVPQVRREPEYDVDAPRLGKFDLAPRRRRSAAARHHRQRAGIFPDRFASHETAVGQTQRVGDEHAVARLHALHRQAPSAEYRHGLAVLRRIEHGPRQTGSPAARLQHERHARAVGGCHAHEIAERWIALYARADVVHGVRRDLRQIIQALDVAGLHAGRAPVPLEKRDLPRALHLRDKTLLLQRAQLLARHAVNGIVERGRRGIVSGEPGEVERLPVIRNVFVIHRASNRRYCSSLMPYFLMMTPQRSISPLTNAPNSSGLNTNTSARSRREDRADPARRGFA